MTRSNTRIAAVTAALLLSCFQIVDNAAQAATAPSNSNPSQAAPGPLPLTVKPEIVPVLTAQPENIKTKAPQLIQSVPSTPEMVPEASGAGLTIERSVESFSELTLKGSKLQAEEPLLGSRGDTPDFVRELWQVSWRSNDPIDLWVILPRGVKNPPVVLYLYGYPTETNRFKNDAYCKRIVAGGAAAVGFVSALTGQRTEYRPPKDTLISKMPEALASTVHDVQMVLNFLEARGDLDMSRVGIFGQGSGGAIAILTASVEPRIKVLDLLDPWADWPEWFSGAPIVRPEDRAEYLKPDFQKPLELLEPLHFLLQLKSQKIRMQFDADVGEPKNAIDKLVAAAPASTHIVCFPSSRDMYNANSGGRLFAWMAKQLDAHPATIEQPASTAPAPAAAAKSNP